MRWMYLDLYELMLIPYGSSWLFLGHQKTQNQVSDSILGTSATSWVHRSTERVGFEPTVPVKTRWFSRPEP